MANKGKHLIENDYTPVTYDPQYILMVNHLKKYFPIKGGLLSQTVGHVKAVDGVTFNLRRGCTMGLVGESGCGKSTTGRTILRLYDSKSGGQVLFNGQEVYDLSHKELRALRTKMQIIFQDPFSSLSPRLPVGEIIGEAVREHNLVPKNEFNDYIDQVMDDCGLQPYHKTRYPHEFSGGQRQRICIARALALNPEFVVCDEPVSALDVSIQAQIINLLKSLQEKRNLTYLFISHDLSVVEHISDTVGVMYLGNLVEYGETDDIFAHPLHPYTKALFSAIPIPDPTVKRERVVLQVDGQIKTGRDVVIGAMLGADEFGFATAPLVVEGCLMMRQCHLNTCPVGIATQDPQLRKRFKGQPSHVVNYFFFVAQEVREIMAQLGVRRFEELIGRSDLLEQRDDIDNWKAQGVDLARVLYRPQSRPEERRHRLAQKHDLEKSLDAQILAEIDRHIRQGQAVRKTYAIRNINRTVGTQIAHAIVDLYGAQGLADDTVHLTFKGTAGQSFGAFAVPGMTMVLEGDANDYVGKGLSGGRIIVKAGDDFHGKAQENIIAGNTTLYGATSGEAYFNGVAGERFAVRLSGASAVVEGTGDHGCEYMTGGTVVVLGKTGRNFASGMSGGVAYVFDAEGDFESHCNTSMVALERVVAKSEQKRSGDSRTWHLGKTDEELLKELIERHARFTGSKLAAELLEHWSNARARFVKVMPLQYKEALLAGAGRQ